MLRSVFTVFSVIISIYCFSQNHNEYEDHTVSSLFDCDSTHLLTYQKLMKFNDKNSEDFTQVRSQKIVQMDSLISYVEWSKVLKLVYLYLDSTEIRLSYGYSEDELVPDDYRVTKFDDEERLSQVLRYDRWDGFMGNWYDGTPDDDSRYIYSDDGLLEREEAYNHTLQDEPFLFSKSIYQYNEDDLLTEVGIYDLVGEDSFRLRVKAFYDYDQQGDLTSRLRVEYFNNNNPNGVKRDSTSYVHKNGNLDTLKSYLFLSDGSVDLFDIFKYQYNDEDQLISEKELIGFDESNDTYIRLEEYLYDYATDGSLIRKKMVVIDSSLFIVYNPYYEERELDLSIPIEEIRMHRDVYLYRDYGFVPQNSLVKSGIQYEENILNSKFNYKTFEFFYSPIDGTSTFEGKSSSSELSVKPNPTSGNIIFDSSDPHLEGYLEIFDLKNQLVFFGDITLGERVDVASLPSGSYVYRVTQNEKYWIGKFIRI